MGPVVQERIARIREMAVEHLELDAEALSDSSLFVDEGVDSLSLIDLVAAVEKEFSIVIDQADLPKMTSLDGVYKVVSDTAGW